MDFLSQINHLFRRDISEQIQNFINGEFVPPEDGKFADTFNPSTGEALCKYPLSTVKDVERAVDAAKSAFNLWSKVCKNERANILNQVAKLLGKRSEAFIRAEIMDQGRAIHGVSKEDNDIAREVLNIKYFTAQAVATMESATKSQDSVSYTSRYPLGVVGIITSWASPLHSILRHAIPALASGNCVVIKPSSLAPVEVHLLAKTFSDAGIPKGVVNVVYGKGDVLGRAMAAHPTVKALALAGSERTASAILAVGQLLYTKKFTFHLGNCHPMIVFEDANLEEVLPVAIRGSFLRNEGQNVHSINRIYVHASILQTFTEKFIRVVQRLKIGSAHETGIQVGPLISKDHRQRIIGLIQGAVNDGAELLWGGKIPKLDSKLGKGFFLEPTILGGFQSSTINTINTLEVQGPVVRIIPFRNANEAIEAANGTMYGLSASVWCKDVKVAHKIADQLNVGSVWINSWLPNEPNMPHESWKQSGLGRTGGAYSIDFYTELKTVSIKF
ncbi:aldehyde dehydrogenase family 8 member A1-like isoform X1 [Stylophora pistillata]|uniref:Aldehyde dehydrogenase family 8 member A1 n=1 Tax=Stylophora pistillata TaxID=50429 RepID=A0A2B4SQX9_STYPI|nr:aldehyde dehydrogenase family 8 member A1-like isoform X1 [Stylophora pistillata]PFX31290.1 Aldehyde dehydrogenase family 8 member A1 [Stylophora pistillata]